MNLLPIVLGFGFGACVIVPACLFILALLVFPCLMVLHALGVRINR
jgi:hypothetical protein